MSGAVHLALLCRGQGQPLPYFSGLHGTSSVTFSGVFRYVNGITPSARADIFKNFAFYPHCVCVCVFFFPHEFRKQNALITVSSTT
jgi:hypothetical protein